MKLDLNSLEFPDKLPSPEWDMLFELVKLNPIGIEVGTSYFNAVPHWKVSERLGDYEFLLHRNKATKQRITEKDSLGVIGFSTINPKDDRVYLTEGVSDFITVKLTHPTMNVLGMTTLSGSVEAKKIVCSLFNKICIVSDSDSTGVKNSQRMRKFYESFGKKCNVVYPDSGFKDITEQFMFYIFNKV